ncbi:hypothetical protein J2W56_002748 [Nocardia kruczakiae]|uniref:DUF5667 domain-containing protein n=1 Tax=Nocardia kruczakiae TaxID=261477 RepID=A0ABU1XGC8_9NOCA|nr:hypothetical protein [Nocardia kruczakiae]MDR7169007.1 hypothetical protein [Nocardia kruczakiae]
MPENTAGTETIGLPKLLQDGVTPATGLPVAGSNGVTGSGPLGANAFAGPQFPAGGPQPDTRVINAPQTPGAGPPATPGSAGPPPGGPHEPGGPTKPGPGKPGPTKPDPTKPDPTKPDPTKPDPTKPDPTKPAPTTPPPANPEKHYWTVELDPPPGAKPAVKAIVALARTAIQTAVDLLGRGMPVPPPEVASLLKPVVFTNLGKSDTTVGYRQAMAAVNARQTSLLEYDQQIARTSVLVAASKDETLASIKNIVAELQAVVKAVPAKATTAQQAALMQQISAAVAQVYRLVDAVYADNQSRAGTSSGSGSGSGTGSSSSSGSASGGSSASGGGGGLGDILGQLLPMAAMILPMGAMVAAPLVTQAMQKNQKDKEAGLHSNGEVTPGTGAAPAATDPNAAVPNAAGPAAAPAAVAPNGAPTALAPGAAAPGTAAPTQLAGATGQTPGTPPPITAPATGASAKDRTKPPTAAPDPNAATPQEPENASEVAP